MIELTDLYTVTVRKQTRAGPKTYVYHYAWRDGPRIKAAPGTPAFAAEYAAHHDARKGGDKDRISGLIVDWKKSDAWILPPEEGGLAWSTRRNWVGPLDDIQDYFGAQTVSAFDDPRSRLSIRRWRDRWKAKPRAADMRKQVLSALLTFAVEEGRLKMNPCFGIANLYSNDRSELVWTEDDIAAYEAVAPPQVYWVVRLACLTGLRQSDLLKLRWSDINSLSIEKTANKSRVRGAGGRDVLIPMYDELNLFLATIPRLGPMVLTNTEGRPWKSGFTSSHNKAMKKAFGPGHALHFHDTRGTFVTRTYELAVFTLAELAEMMAWSEEKVERIINRYVRKDALLRDKIRRIDDARQARGVAS